jgi:WD40 repeat protein
VNGNTINIFATYTCENLGYALYLLYSYKSATCDVTVEASRNLRGHNGKVRSVCWSADDTMLVSCGMDGAAYEWSLKDFKRVGESVLKSCNYTCAGAHFTCFTSTKVRVLTQQGCAVCTPDGKTTFAVGTDKKVLTLLAFLAQKVQILTLLEVLQIKEIAESNLGVFDIVKEHEAGSQLLTQVVLSHSGRMLFTGADNGTVQSWKFPLSHEFQEYQCHSRAVTRMCMTYDDAHLFTVSDDGCLLIIDVRDKEIRASKRDKEMLAFSEEILVTKSDLDEKTAQMRCSLYLLCWYKSTNADA